MLEVIIMNSNQMNPNLSYYFEMLPIDVKNQILESDTDINTLDDLLQCVNSILGGTF